MDATKMPSCLYSNIQILYSHILAHTHCRRTELSLYKWAAWWVKIPFFPFCQMGKLDCCQSLYLNPDSFVYFRLRTPSWWGKDREWCHLTPQALIRSCSGSCSHPPLPASIPHLAAIEVNIGGLNTGSQTGVSSCDPDVLIPWSLTGSESLAKWPPPVGLPVPMLPLRRKEGCGLLSSGAAHSLSPPQPD